jgi:hypothetical protein
MIEGRNVDDSPNRAISQMERVVAKRESIQKEKWRENWKVKDPSYHVKFSWSPNDKPTENQMREVADRCQFESCHINLFSPYQTPTSSGLC